MKKLIVGNWKMNKTIEEANSLIVNIVNKIHENSFVLERCEFVVCPSFLHIGAIRDVLCDNDVVTFGGQDCSKNDNGAHTGDVSAKMIKDAGGIYVIVGHSERRENYGETDEIVAAKAAKAHEAGLTAIICVGEQEKDREQGRELEIVASQMSGSIPSSATVKNTVLAYEPVWAIGTGKTASVDDVRIMHGFIQKKLQEQLEISEELRILYGGSMKAENSAELLATPNVNGGLIGGASLEANQFLAIALSA
ncbi:MAG: triose-phosphate isomerase [Alphaproteobacteria bacterium]|nr:triose-phosphate isomerase [Alphaproteobacteria bacterium]